MLKFKKKLIISSLILGNLIILPVTGVNAEIKTYEGIGEYVMSDFETPDIAKERAKQRAQRAAQELAGVYVESFTKVENMTITKDEIITLTNGILQVFDVNYQTLPSSDGIGVMIRATLKANIDTAKVDEWLQKGVGERSELVAKNKQLQLAIEEQNRQIEELKAKLAAANAQNSQEQLKSQFESADKIFMSNQKVDEADKLFDDGKFDEAFKKYSEAIELNPQNSGAYAGRGGIYIDKENFNAAIDDFNNAIKFDDSQAYIYNNRAVALINLEKYEEALSDLEKAVELDENFALAYTNLATIFIIMESYKDAIEVCDFAEKLDPNEPAIYLTRGNAYFNLGKYKKALKDYQKAIELDPNDKESAEGIEECKKHI